MEARGARGAGLGRGEGRRRAVAVPPCGARLASVSPRVGAGPTDSGGGAGRRFTHTRTQASCFASQRSPPLPLRGWNSGSFPLQAPLCILPLVSARLREVLSPHPFPGSPSQPALDLCSLAALNTDADTLTCGSGCAYRATK